MCSYSRFAFVSLPGNRAACLHKFEGAVTDEGDQSVRPDDIKDVNSKQENEQHLFTPDAKLLIR